MDVRVHVRTSISPFLAHFSSIFMQKKSKKKSKKKKSKFFLKFFYKKKFAGACTTHYENVCDVRAGTGADENQRTLKVCFFKI